MIAIQALKNKGLFFAEKLNCIPKFLARLTIGMVFIESGWGKLNHLPKVVEYFKNLGIPAAEIQAPFVAMTEFSCGLLVFLGIQTRLASMPLICIMIVAIMTAKLKEFEHWTDLFAASEFLYIVVLLYLITEGPGMLSVDTLIKKRLRGS